MTLLYHHVLFVSLTWKLKVVCHFYWILFQHYNNVNSVNFTEMAVVLTMVAFPFVIKCHASTFVFHSNLSHYCCIVYDLSWLCWCLLYVHTIDTRLCHVYFRALFGNNCWQLYLWVWYNSTHSASVLVQREWLGNYSGNVLLQQFLLFIWLGGSFP